MLLQEDETGGYVADCVALLRGARPDEWGPEAKGVAVTPAAVAANLAFVVAHTGGFASESSGGSYGEGFEAERIWQQAWLADRLGLENPS